MAVIAKTLPSSIMEERIPRAKALGSPLPRNENGRVSGDQAVYEQYPTPDLADEHLKECS